MKNQLKKPLLLLLLSSPFFCLGQEDTTQGKKFRNEIATDISKGLTTIINSRFFNSSNYALFYKRHCKYTTLRLTLGGNFNDNTNESLRDTFVYTEKSSYYSLNPSVGLEWEYSWDKKWMAVYGADLLFSRSLNVRKDYNNANTYATTRTETNNQFNIGPFLGIKYKINKRFSLSTEISIVAGFFERKTTLVYDYSNNTNTSSIARGTQVLVNKTILLHFNF